MNPVETFKQRHIFRCTFCGERGRIGDTVRCEYRRGIYHLFCLKAVKEADSMESIPSDSEPLPRKPTEELRFGDLD